MAEEMTPAELEYALWADHDTAWLREVAAMEEGRHVDPDQFFLAVRILTEVSWNLAEKLADVSTHLIEKLAKDEPCSVIGEDVIDKYEWFMAKAEEAQNEEAPSG